MTFDLKPATQTDLPFVHECAIAAYSKYIEAIGEPPAPMIADFARHFANDELYLLTSDTRNIGFVVWWTAEDHLFVDNIAVAPNLQGKGVARFVFDHLEKVAIAASLPAIKLYTNVAMNSNLGLYPHLGFVETDRRRESGFDRVFFTKHLSIQ